MSVILGIGVIISSHIIVSILCYIMLKEYKAKKFKEKMLKTKIGKHTKWYYINRAKRRAKEREDEEREEWEDDAEDAEFGDLH